MLRDLGRNDEAAAVNEAQIANSRRSIELYPTRPQGHNDLGDALRDQRKVEEAAAEYREVLRLRPNFTQSRDKLVYILEEQGKYDEAIALRQEDLQLRPDAIKARYALSLVLRDAGHYDESLAEIKRARELALKKPNGRATAEQTAQQFAVAVQLHKNLPAFLSGKEKPSDASVSAWVAQAFYERKLFGAATMLWDDTFKARPSMADDQLTYNRYNAACGAALAGSGQGKDDPPLEELTKARCRRQALDWLKADLAAWSKAIADESSQWHDHVPQTLQHWKADPDLAGIRDPAALAKLPPDEQKAFAALWVEVSALLKKAQSSASN